MNTIFSSFKLLVIATLLSLLAACGGSSNGASGEVLLTCSVPLIPNEAGTECVAPPPINSPPPTVPDENNEWKDFYTDDQKQILEEMKGLLEQPKVQMKYKGGIADINYLTRSL